MLEEGENGYPVEVDCEGLDDWTPLHFACYEGHEDLVALLCKHKAMVNAVTRYSRNGLHIAALRGHFAVVKTLINCGIAINAYDSDGNSALHFAAENGHRDIIAFLLESGCRVTKNREGATPI
jgi:ankyrin repeat protein